MKTKIEEIWDAEQALAASKPIESNSFRLTRLDTEHVHDLYAGIDDALHPVLGLGVLQRPAAISLESDAFDYFRRQRADGSWLLVLRLQRPGLESVFGRLCLDLAEASRTVKTEGDLLALFVRRLRLWEKLFLAAQDALLAVHQIRGLVAELLILEGLLNSRPNALAETVIGWVGPTGADQDFRLADISIEVKASHPGARSVRISSLRQLQTTSPLFLVVVTLAKSSAGTGAAMSLNSLVARLESLVASSSEALAIFRERLVAAGYVDHPRYDEDWHIQVDSAAYSVSEDFPRVVVGNVPPAVLSASYELDLSALAKFRLQKLLT
jgi:hypothetical protein